MFDLETESKCHGIQHSLCSMANIDLYKIHTWAFFANFHRFRDIPFQNSLPGKCRSISWCTTIAVEPFGGKYLTSYLMVENSNVCSIAHRLRDICESRRMSKLLPWTWKSRSRSRGTKLSPIDEKCSISYSWNFQNFSYLATYVYVNRHTDTHTHTYTHSERQEWWL